MTWAKKGENKYTAKKSNYKVEENVGTLTVTDGTPENPVKPSLAVNKTHDTDKTYKAGDVITFTITVKNIYDEAKTITLEEQEGVTLDKTTFENVKPGKEITASAAYTVTEADIVNGTFTNNVKATFSGVDKEYTGTDTVDKFEESRPHMTITKVTKDAGKNHIYKLGETINYVITVENDGNLTLTNVKIEDALTGNAGENAWTIDTFAPGEKQTFETPDLPRLYQRNNNRRCTSPDSMHGFRLLSSFLSHKYRTHQAVPVSIALPLNIRHIRIAC